MILRLGYIVLICFIGIEASLYHHQVSNDLLITLKNLHQTLSTLVSTLASHSKNGSASSKINIHQSITSSSGNIGSHSNSHSSHPTQSSIIEQSNKADLSVSSVSNSFNEQNNDDDLSIKKASTRPISSGKRPFQCAAGYAGSYTRIVHSPEPGVEYTSNQIEAKWAKDYGWDPAFIIPISNITLNPSSKVLTYGQQVFEEILANMGYDNRIRLFRPRLHLSRLRKAAERLALPDFNEEELLLCIKRLVLSDASLIPSPYSNSSLEIRIVLMGTSSSLEIMPATEAILYVYLIRHSIKSLSQHNAPRNLYVDPSFTRSWPGFVGEHMTVANFAPNIYVTHHAHSLGFNDVLWVYGKDELVQSVNNGNIFVFIINDRGRRELITPPLNGLIIPGVTRQTILEMAKHWNEFLVTERSLSIHEIRTLNRQGRLLEMFISNTMANTVPIVSVYYEPKRDIIRVAPIGQSDSLQIRFDRAFRSIENGLIDHPWGYIL